MFLARYQALIGGDYGIYQTVGELTSLVNASLLDPDALIRRRAEEILGPSPEKDDLSEVAAIFDYVQSALHYVDDPTGIELLKNPKLIDQEVTANGQFLGDCDDASGYLAALLKAVGYQVEFVIVTPADADGFDYRHIYVRVWLPRQNRWMGLDPTAKAYPMGWEVKSKKLRAYVV